jgi:antibiotic biosynthesis monooxygenase (ABM) superfamily enzyme
VKAIHVAITRRVKPGMEQQFESALRAFIRESLRAPGTIGAQLISPGPDDPVREFGILRSFESESAQKAFYLSPSYAQWKEQVSPLVDGEPTMRRLHGFVVDRATRNDRHVPNFDYARRRRIRGAQSGVGFDATIDQAICRLAA